jgi:hypothetical protein
MFSSRKVRIVLPQRIKDDEMLSVLRIGRIDDFSPVPQMEQEIKNEEMWVINF